MKLNEVAGGRFVVIEFSGDVGKANYDEVSAQSHPEALAQYLGITDPEEREKFIQEHSSTESEFVDYYDQKLFVANVIERTVYVYKIS